MHRTTRRSGRISFVALAAFCSIALVGFLLLFTGQSPRSAAADFMSALSTGDVAKLTDLSVVQKKSKEEIRKDWEQTMKYSRHYLFLWNITNIRSDAESATARLDITKNPMNPMSYAEHYELQLVKTDGGWKVDVTQIARDMYPFLPQ